MSEPQDNTGRRHDVGLFHVHSEVPKGWDKERLSKSLAVGTNHARTFIVKCSSMVAKPMQRN